MDAASAAAAARSAEVERSSLCNCVVNFLLQEKYHLTAFELLHELIEDGRHDQAIRLREFFSDPNLFPPDLIARFNSLRVADPQTLLEEKLEAQEKLAISEYELRLAKEDVSRLKEELQKLADSTLVDGEIQADVSRNDASASQLDMRERPVIDFGPLKDTERKDLNCAVKEYLVLAGYRLTAMTFYEEVADQSFDSWTNSPACISDALRHYYYQFLSSSAQAAEEKIRVLQENESLMKENERLNAEKSSFLKSKALSDSQVVLLTKSLEAAQKELKEKDLMVLDLKQSLEFQRKQLNDCRAEITSLKMYIEGSRASKGWMVGEHELKQPIFSINGEEVNSSTTSMEELKGIISHVKSSESLNHMNADNQHQGKDDQISLNREMVSGSCDPVSDVPFVENVGSHMRGESNTTSEHLSTSCNGNGNSNELFSESKFVDNQLVLTPESPKKKAASGKMVLETIQILSDALPKIVPYVLINHREELLPLIMCAIERHPDSGVRDSLTHTLFNLIKRPDEQQRRIIMDACVSLAKNVGEMRTETELLPQCWEQINHTYEERRLLVAQSCGELAQFVRPEIRDSLILSIVQQLIEDSATIVREAAAHNLAMLLPLSPNLDKYFKVEELMFQLACDPSRMVVDTTLKELLPAVIKWGRKLDHVLRILMAHLLGSAQRCPPVTGVAGSLESYLRVLGEGERWNIDVLLRMLIELLPDICQKAIETCPFTSSLDPSRGSETTTYFFSPALLQLYAGGLVDWPEFEWLHVDCFHDLIQLACLLTQKEDNLRNRITKLLLSASDLFGDDYLQHIMLPVFLVAVGDNADLTFFPTSTQSRVNGLRPKTATAERLSIMCVLPLLLSGILGASSMKELLSGYLRKLLVQNTGKEGPRSVDHSVELIDAVRFLCTFEEHHGIIFNILWEMVVSANVNMKINATRLLKVLVPYVDVKVASTQVVPALITLGSDQNLNVKYASIDAFGAVAQHFKNDMIVDKIRVQMDAFLEDGSHEATIAVVRALVVAVPHTTDRLREYLLSKIFHLTGTPSPSDLVRRCERANAFCEALRALDATDLPAISVRDILLPAIQNLLKDPDSLDPAHKEALEIIMKDRSGGTLETISKVMGTHLGIASSVTSFFGENGLLAKRESSGDPSEAPAASPQPSPQAQGDDTRLRWIMRGNLGDMLRGRGKGHEEPPK